MATEVEGIIKFHYECLGSASIAPLTLKLLNEWRTAFYQRQLIGEYQNPKVGYGNLSARLTAAKDFVISASGTGGKEQLTYNDYVHVEQCDLPSFSLKYRGQNLPSSESFTHYALYEASDDINFVFHVHSKKIWQYMLKMNYPTVPQNIEYGTDAMALFFKQQKDLAKKPLFVMAGHEDGILSFASDAAKAGESIIKVYNMAT